MQMLLTADALPIYFELEGPFLIKSTSNVVQAQEYIVYRSVLKCIRVNLLICMDRNRANRVSYDLELLTVNLTSCARWNVL